MGGSGPRAYRWHGDLSIWVPLALHEEGLDSYVCRTLGIDEGSHPIDISEWESAAWSEYEVEEAY